MADNRKTVTFTCTDELYTKLLQRVAKKLVKGEKTTLSQITNIIVEDYIKSQETDETRD